jgi:hypothetical protein
MLHTKMALTQELSDLITSQRKSDLPELMLLSGDEIHSTVTDG